MQIGQADGTYQEIVALGLKRLVSAAFTRPANTTAYAALATVADKTAAASLLTFVKAARIAGGSGYITKARVTTNNAGIVPRLRLHLYHTAPGALNDGAAFAALFANKDKRVGTLDLGPLATEGVGSDCAYAYNAGARLGFVLPAGSQDIYAMVETLDAFTPASGQQFFFELMVEAD